MRPDLLDILAPPALGLVFLLLSWSQMHVTRGRHALTPYDRKLLIYGFFFVLGMGYLMLIGKLFRWRPSMLFVVIGAWGVLLALIAWQRYRRAQAASQAPRIPLSSSLAEGLPVVGLLVCLVASVVEWSLWIDGKAHLIVALVWTAGVPAIIVLARRNRWPTVIMALRVFFGLLVIGAIAQKRLLALAAAGVVGVVLFLLERVWTEKPALFELESRELRQTERGESASNNKPH